MVLGLPHNAGHRRRGGRWEERLHAGRGILEMDSSRGRGARVFGGLWRVRVSRLGERECSENLRAETDGLWGALRAGI